MVSLHPPSARPASLPGALPNLLVKGDAPRLVFFTALAFCVLLTHFFLVKIINLAAFPLLAILAFALMLVQREIAFVLLIVSVLAQNCLVALMTEFDAGQTLEFTIMLATNFVLTVVMGGVCLIEWIKARRMPGDDSLRLLRASAWFAAIILAYSLIGLGPSSVKSVLVYDRVYLGALGFLVIGIASGMVMPYSLFPTFFKVFAGFMVIWGWAELFFTKEMLDAFNVIDYVNMKYLGFNQVVTSVDELLGSNMFLNLSGQFRLDFRLPQMRGPNIHPISFGYGLCFCGLICFMFRSYFLAANCLILLVLAGVKGAIIMALFSLVLVAAYRFSGYQPRKLAKATTIMVVLYVALFMIYGHMSRDFHYLGLMGSIRGFLTNPIGHGVGVGGNLSDQGDTYGRLAHFMVAQGRGYTEVALESAIGVMIYQIGIGCLAFILFYKEIVRQTWRIATADGVDPRAMMLPLGLILLLVNALFQEEAFSPTGLGLWMLFAGYTLGHHWWRLRAAGKAAVVAEDAAA